MSAISHAINPFYLPGRRAAEHTGANRFIFPAQRSGHIPTRPNLVQARARGSWMVDGRLARPAISAGNLVQPASHTAGFHLTTSL